MRAVTALQFFHKWLAFGGKPLYNLKNRDNPISKGHPIMSMTDTERRKLFRVEIVTPVRFQLIDEKTTNSLTDWKNGATADVSLGGMKITAAMTEAEAEILVAKYVLIKISFQPPGTSKAIDATASLAYFLRSEGVQAATVTFGVSFVAIDFSATDVLGEFIRQRIDFLT
jgi:c-di-GMP-binding flagellar brake protein YcgR